MKSSFVREILLYRFRYIIGYILVVALTVGLTVWQINTIPNGLSVSEQHNVVHSATLSFSTSTSPIDAPYYLLQKLSLHIFGLSTLGIKLPSLLIGITSGIMIMLLLLRLFRRNVAIITSIFAVTASQFLIASRTADSGIMLLLWPVAIMLLATLLSQQVKHKRLLGFTLSFAIALSLYTPLLVYLIVAVGFAALLHPHLRYVARSQGIKWLLLQILLLLVVVAPLGYDVYNNSAHIYELLGITPHVSEFKVYAGNLWNALKQYADFIHPSITTMIAPVFNIGVLILILLGFLRVVSDHFSARSHMLMVWLTFLVIVVSIKPQTLLLLFVPSILLLGIGVQSLIREWYKLFPRNPYARIAGLLPLGTFLIIALVFNYTSYFYGFAYTPQVADFYSRDLHLLKTELNPTTPTLVVVTNDQVPLFGLLSRQDSHVQFIQPASLTTDSLLPKDVIVSSDAAAQLEPAVAARLQPEHVIVNAHSHDSLRFTYYAVK